ncbi:hypothetical protein LCGC14_1130900 [marine sediment metagenome]|uniref:Uncharacterized protein n=1 Tax=marine sediment metagenome TaxID=412755 RepID=A0A0F9M5Z5_9ZZZZ
MAINVESAKRAEEIAKRLAVEAGQAESLWELFLMPAYAELTSRAAPNDTAEQESGE